MRQDRLALTSGRGFHLDHGEQITKAREARDGQRELTDELIIDATRYTQMAGVDALICLVYDPGHRCSNPRAVETDAENSGSRLAVRAVICPQGL